MTDRVVRIGGAAGFWGDSPDAVRQMLGAGVDYIMLDYLAEVTMAILARARERAPEKGYATDFIDVMNLVLQHGGDKAPRIVTNAGGVNPRACRDALLSLAAKLGVSPKIAIVEGDDLLDRCGELATMGLKDIDYGTGFPECPWSVNAYLGALPIAEALAAGADIVITGRCVDSALVLGPLIAEFGWSADDYDLLAAGSLAGHVIECGCQATGGNFTDWREVEGWEDMGFPIAECAADGSFTVTKPDGTGGLVSPLSVGEQIVYEIGDPASYILPDVVCDFTQVTLEQTGANRVVVRGAHGRQPTDTYKVSATFQDGFRSTAMFTICGRDAVAKAKRVGEAIVARTRRQFVERGLEDYTRTDLKILGIEQQYGPNANPILTASREVVLRMDVHHAQKEALDIFAREIAPAGLAMAPGRCGLFGGRPNVSPMIGHRAFLVSKDKLPVTVLCGSSPEVVSIPHGVPYASPEPAEVDDPETRIVADSRRVPLWALACARSGDKGDNVNIGVIARHRAIVPVLRQQLTSAKVKDHFGNLVVGAAERFELPAMGAFNFLLHGALGGGGTSSLRNDPQGKTFAQMLLDIELDVPAALVPPH